jgi:predicted nucleotide-binding protein (sugar kinase/HSP70/actin superfamily)
VLYGDLLMLIANQCRPYELQKGATDKLLLTWQRRLEKAFQSREFLHTKRLYKRILDDFAAIPRTARNKVRVGIVGEIYVKYSPYANNHLCDYLFHAGVEPTLPSLNEFVLYCMKNYFIDNEYYGRNRLIMPFLRPFYKHCIKKTRKCAEMLKGTNFLPYSDFEEVVACGKKVIDLGVKMGEGWVIPAEMVDYATHGVENIVVVQPFGCLPNHIVGKGMIRPVKELCPNANIVPLDFDASSTSVNQENRLKLMLSNIQGE